MAGLLTPRRTFGLYGLVLTVLFAVWLGVLSAGRQRWVVVKESKPLRSAEERVLDTDEPMRDFYEELDSASGKARSRPLPPAQRTAVVQPPPSEPAAAASPALPARPVSTGPRWVVQIGAFSRRQPASQARLRAQAKGLPVRLIEPNPAAGDPYFRVWVGDDYASQEDAKVMEEVLKSHGISYYTKKIP